MAINPLADAVTMIRDIRQRSRIFGLWGGFLNIPHVLGGLLFITRIEAALILVTAVFSVLSAAQIHKRHPFTRLTSLVHVVWLPLFPYLVFASIQHGWSDVYGIWLGFSVTTMGISLVLDARNLFLYFYSANRAFESDS